MAKTPRSQCRGLGFDPWSGNWVPHAIIKPCQINKQIKYFRNKQKTDKDACFFLPICIGIPAFWIKEEGRDYTCQLEGKR